ncbi:gluconate 2-dehydrogenase subunit 3 family protein [Tumebacillus lipolyticus]|uniref:Gluconate 2-dehydrogenase subunit 3 family protein n=1 Tax=Tumebacillus lipolyticus TaxID=1280370 RepID=A0ABW4ZWI6_9BACL
MDNRTNYPNYDVMDEQAHWDAHTRQIVQKRLATPGSFAKLTSEEVDAIRAMAALLVDDGRSFLLDYIVDHFNAKLISDSGEGQRQAGVPELHALLKQGLAALEALAQKRNASSYPALRPQLQLELLMELEDGTVKLIAPNGDQIPARAFFQKMLTETVSAYYSHPTVWSEIGYGGPAYPRGYVRSELGLTDPWEARKDG